jgi:hypothetical protein
MTARMNKTALLMGQKPLLEVKWGENYFLE